MFSITIPPLAIIFIQINELVSKWISEANQTPCTHDYHKRNSGQCRSVIVKLWSMGAHFYVGIYREKTLDYLFKNQLARKAFIIIENIIRKWWFKFVKIMIPGDIVEPYWRGVVGWFFSKEYKSHFLKWVPLPPAIFWESKWQFLSFLKVFFLWS